MSDANANNQTPPVGEQSQRGAEPSPGPADELAALRTELQAQTEQARHNLDQWKRTAADLANYRKRVEREREETRRIAQVEIMARLLPVLDDFERAFQTMPGNLDGLTWVQGIALIERKMIAMLEQQGLQEIEALGKTFDPALHQAVLTLETTAYPDGQVTAVLQKGYRLANQVLRPAMVQVAKNTTGNPTQATSTPTTESGSTHSEHDQTTQTVSNDHMEGEHE